MSSPTFFYLQSPDGNWWTINANDQADSNGLAIVPASAPIPPPTEDPEEG